MRTEAEVRNRLKDLKEQNAYLQRALEASTKFDEQATLKNQLRLVAARMSEIMWVLEK